VHLCWNWVVCCSVLQCVAVCCSVLQCVAVCCSALQCVAVRCSVLPCVAVCCRVLQCAVIDKIDQNSACVSLQRQHMHLCTSTKISQNLAHYEMYCECQLQRWLSRKNSTGIAKHGNFPNKKISHTSEMFSCWENFVKISYNFVQLYTQFLIGWGDFDQ